MKGIPVITIQKETLAEAWEAALLAVYYDGILMPTQYDKEGDEESRDATVNITIEDPLKEPMIHKAGMVGGIEDLREYVMELEGAKNHWVRNMNDPDDKRWNYTYNQRLTNWGSWYERSSKIVIGRTDTFEPIMGHKRYSKSVLLPSEETDAFEYGHSRTHHGNINQIDVIIDKLAKQPFTRQAQAITWMPFMDLFTYDGPCLQSLIFRLNKGEHGAYHLNTNIRFRSNDAWQAFFMNCFGLIHFICSKIIAPLSKKMECIIFMDRINWQADSFHIYGKDIADFKSRFLNKFNDSSFEDRVMNFHDNLIQEIWHEAKGKIEEKIRKYDAEHQ